MVIVLFVLFSYSKCILNTLELCTWNRSFARKTRILFRLILVFDVLTLTGHGNTGDKTTYAIWLCVNSDRYIMLVFMIFIEYCSKYLYPSSTSYCCGGFSLRVTQVYLSRSLSGGGPQPSCSCSRYLVTRIFFCTRGAHNSEHVKYGSNINHIYTFVFHFVFITSSAFQQVNVVYSKCNERMQLYCAFRRKSNQWEFLNLKIVEGRENAIRVHVRAHPFTPPYCGHYCRIREVFGHIVFGRTQ